MAQQFESLLEVLNGTAPPPATNFLHVVGQSLDRSHIEDLSTAVEGSSFSGGFRVKGGSRVIPR